MSAGMASCHHNQLCAAILLALLVIHTPPSDQPELCPNSAAGKIIPRRIICTGFCIGGAVATLAACWAGLQWPTADIRCITFGAPRVGNSQFVEAFRLAGGRPSSGGA